MFKYMWVVVAALVSLSAGASINATPDNNYEDVRWRVVNVADSGTSLVVNVESIKIKPYGADTGPERHRVVAIMRYIGKEFSLPFVASIDVEECLVRRGGILVNRVSKTEVLTYTWNDKGTQMLDAQGRWMCDHVIQLNNHQM